MNLKQLQLVCEMVKANYNVSRTAEAMFTSQPGISATLKNLEDELSTKIFIRHGKRITGLSPAGKSIHQYAREVLFNVKAIKEIGQEFSDKSKGTLNIVTTHTQARYVLPPVIKKFAKRYPDIQLRIHQGSPNHISEMVIQGQADFAIATESVAQSSQLTALPIYQWNRCVVTQKNHPLLKKRKKITLEDISEYPIITYDFAFTGRSIINRAFKEKNLTPNIVMTAMDSDVIKTYVELGLGIGLLANMAFDSKADKDLRKLEVKHLFEQSTTYIGFRKNQLIREYIYHFIHLLAPHLSKENIIRANS